MKRIGMIAVFISALIFSVSPCSAQPHKHVAKYVKTEKPTCVKDGYKYYKCAVPGCGKVAKKRYASKYGHSYKLCDISGTNIITSYYDMRTRKMIRQDRTYIIGTTVRPVPGKGYGFVTSKKDESQTYQNGIVKRRITPTQSVKISGSIKKSTRTTHKETIIGRTKIIRSEKQVSTLICMRCGGTAYPRKKM